jgi:hypothetical protein
MSDETRRSSPTPPPGAETLRARITDEDEREATALVGHEQIMAVASLLADLRMVREFLEEISFPKWDFATEQERQRILAHLAAEGPADGK